MAIKQNNIERKPATKFEFGSDANTVEYARKQDSQDALKHLRSEFTIPSVSDLRRKQLAPNGTQHSLNPSLVSNPATKSSSEKTIPLRRASTYVATHSVCSQRLLASVSMPNSTHGPPLV